MNQDKPATKRGDANPKIQFVLSMPRDIPAAEVSARAKEAGLVIKSGYVHTIRSAAKKAAEKAAGKAGPAAAAKSPKGKTASPKPAPKRRGRPPQAAPKAKPTGAAVPPATKPAARKAKGKRKPAPVRPAHAVSAVASQKAIAKTPSLETTFRKLVLELGLARSRALLEEVDQKLARLIAGT